MLIGLKRLTQFHEDIAVIDWWCANMAGALNWLTTFRRRAILCAIAIIVSVKYFYSALAKAHSLSVPVNQIGSTLVAMATFGILLLVYRASIRFASLPIAVRRYPQLTMHLLYWCLLAILWNTTPMDGAWRAVLLGVAITFPLFIWRCGYALLSGQQGRAAGSHLTDHLLCLLPLHSGSNTPYVKGTNYLSRLEAKTIEELARAQLSGIKLLALAGLWTLGLYVMEGVLYGSGNDLNHALNGHNIKIPRLSELVAGGAQSTLYLSWVSIYCELIWQVLHYAAQGHVLIAMLRLFGFNVFRNTYKPLLAESVQEFWNRYYYYFKELLVSFFFMPAFMQLGGLLHKWPRLRLFAAVFAAAFVGNIYYHLLEKNDLLTQGDVSGAIYSLGSQFFYSFLLAIGIYVSMLRKERRGVKKPSTAPAARFARIFGVWTFFSLIFIWDVKSGATFSSRTHFFLSLFGLA